MTMKTTFASLLAVASLAAGGVALAQTAPAAGTQSSTPGAGCTATGNAMKSGNLGGGPSGTACNTTGTTAATSTAPAAAPATVATPAPAAAPATAGTDTSASSSSTTSSSSTMGASSATTDTAAPAPVRKTRTARADRG